MKKGMIAAFAAMFGIFGAASAAPVGGGATVIEPTIDLQTVGLQASLLGDASLNANGFFEFPITGGELDGLAGTIEHDDSGARLTNGLRTVDLQNFVIDTTSSSVFADILVDGSAVGNAAILSFDVGTLSDISVLFDLSDPSLSLVFTMAASGLLQDVFGITASLTGLEFGLAATSPEVVPVPAAFGLFAFGAGLLAIMRRRRPSLTRRRE